MTIFSGNSNQNDTFVGAANVADVFQFAVADLNSLDTLVGGAGLVFDILKFTTPGTVAASAFANVSGVERVTLSAGSNALTLTNALVGSATGTYLMVNGNAGNDTVNTSAVTTAAHRVDISAGAGNDTLTGGAGNDVFKFTVADLSSADTVVGGGGRDALILYGAGTVAAAALTNVSGLEQIALGTGSINLTVSNAVALANGPSLAIWSRGSDTVNASAIVSSTRRIDVTAGSGADRFTGGAGADLFRFAAADLTSSDTVAGGSGGAIDVLQLTTPGTVTAAALANVTGIERITLANGVNSLTLANTMVSTANNRTLVVTGGMSDDTVDASAVNLASNRVDLYGHVGNDTITGGAGRDILFGGEGADVLTGGAGDDTLNGGDEFDNLIGGAGTDTLYGTGDPDVLTGGAGNDIYYIDFFDHTVVEAAGGGDDTVYSLFGYTLADEVENLILIGTFANFGGGNGSNNAIAGNSFANTLDGGGGNDTLYGGGGNDELGGYAGIDTMYGGSGDNGLTGGDANDTMYGGDGNDELTGGSGLDFVNGGIGNDTLYINLASEAVAGETYNGGTDTDTLNGLGVFTPVNLSAATLINLESIVGFFNSGMTLTAAQLDQFNSSIFTGAITLSGVGVADISDAVVQTETFNLSAAGNTLTLNGSGGVLSTVNGGAGADTVTIHGGADGWQLVGAGGNDRLTGGNGRDSLFAGDGNDMLNGGDGDDEYVVGGAGRDTVNGGGGNDTLHLFAASDLLANETYDGGAGIDMLSALSVSHADLSVITLTNLESIDGFGSLTLTSAQLDQFNTLIQTGTITLSGAGVVDISDAVVATDTFNLSAAGNTLTLGDGNPLHLVRGGAAADTVTNLADFSGSTLIGNGGNDQLTGGRVDDFLVGGDGNDTLTGGLGADGFIFTTAAPAAVDIFADFNELNGGGEEGDLLMFQGIGNAATFAYLGTGAFTNTGKTEARVSGNQVLVDLDGNAIADIVIALTGLTNAAQLAASDFSFV